MRIIAYCPIHYGKDYLKASIESYTDLVDEIYMLYSPTPSYGHTGNLINPDSEQELKHIALQFRKVHWIKVHTGQEASHRSMINQYSNGADLIIATDSDEVWNTESLEKAIPWCLEQPFGNFGVTGFRHFWRSLSKVCHDGFIPIRMIRPGLKGETRVEATIYHFGYCITSEMMRYKWSIHGHKDELRPGWIEDTYLSDKVIDLHPVAIGLWNATYYDKNEIKYGKNKTWTSLQDTT